ncbi:hypothetical protein AURDEDRAFT_172361 [Auricularia subglabra TFB-10046 SS5]|nr:hypothetical protein AURDEDRAFT_172361 [Auricularia subglabra TFB-10046 SS5]
MPSASNPNSKPRTEIEHSQRTSESGAVYYTTITTTTSTETVRLPVTATRGAANNPRRRPVSITTRTTRILETIRAERLGAATTPYFYEKTTTKTVRYDTVPY